MDTKVRYIIVGLFVITLTAILMLSMFWFSASQHKNYETYIVYMNEAVSGLSEQAPVKFNGVEVGHVKEIKLNHKNLKQVKLYLSIQEEVPINQSTRATLMTQGITGITYVGLKASAARAPLITIQPGETYKVIPSDPSLLLQLDSTIRQISSDIQGVTKLLGKLFSDENQEAIHKNLENLTLITQTLANSSNDIATGAHNISKASGELGPTLYDSRIAIQNISQQAIPSIIQTLNKLTGVSNNLEQLTNNLKDNPSILVRGKAAQPPGPGE